MRILITLLLAVALVVGIGFYMGWFRLTSERGSDESNVTLTVDEDKLQRDARTAKEKVVGPNDGSTATAGKK